MATPSIKQASKMKKKTTSLRRRRNQKAEIDELASHFQSSTPATTAAAADLEQTETSGDSKTSAIDKLSVLRLTTAFLKFQNFLKDISPSNGGHASPKKELTGLMEEAIDGFLIILDKDASILYVSETITDCVGLRQQDLIGQSLVDIAYSSCADEITDSLKPSITFQSSAMENSVLSQPRQFHLMFKSTASSTRNNSYTMVLVHGNLKVKMPPLETTCSGKSGQKEIVEPSVIGFVGVCELVESATSADDIVIPTTTFTWSTNLDKKTINSVDRSVKDVMGFSPDVFENEDVLGEDFVHPEDWETMLKMMPTYLMHTGFFVSPHFRVLSSSGLWIWIRASITLQWENGKAIAEMKCKALSQGKSIKYIMQREIHAAILRPGQDPLNPHTFTALSIPKPMTTPTCTAPGTTVITDSNEPLSSSAMVSQSSFSMHTAHYGTTPNAANSIFQLPNHPSDPVASSSDGIDTGATNKEPQASGRSCTIASTIPQTTSSISTSTISPNSQLIQQPPYEQPLNSDVDSSPPLSDSSRCSSLEAQLQSSSSSVAVTPPVVPQSDFQFHRSHTNQLGTCPPFDHGTSSPPMSTFELGVTLDATISADSASCASGIMGVSTFDQFHNSHQAFPYSGSYDFNHQVPLNFDSSSNTAPYYPFNYPNSSVFRATCLNGPDPSSPPENPISGTFNPAIYPASSIAHINDSNSQSAFHDHNALPMAPMMNWGTSTSSVMNMASGQFQY